LPRWQRAHDDTVELAALEQIFEQSMLDELTAAARALEKSP
jgi:hypothetical protein